MEKNKDKRLEEKEKLDAESERSSSVIKVKEAHKRIEEIEKLRKRSTILSIIQRLDLIIGVNKGVFDELMEVQKKLPKEFWNKKVSDSLLSEELDHIVKSYESIRFDLQCNIDAKNGKFDRLFPKEVFNYETLNDLTSSIIRLIIQMRDMQAYCLRLL